MRPFLHQLGARVHDSLVHRPWLMDIAAGAGSIAWGLWVAHAGRAGLAQMIDHGGWKGLAPVMPEIINGNVLLGLAQLGVALLKLHRSRQGVAMAKAVLWGYVAYGLNSPSGQAAYGILAVYDFLIFARCY